MMYILLIITSLLTLHAKTSILYKNKMANVVKRFLEGEACFGGGSKHAAKFMKENCPFTISFNR